MVSWTPLTGSAKVLSNHTLLIQDSRVSDAGMYTCTAMNSVGSDSMIVVVSVRGETYSVAQMNALEEILHVHF